MGVIEIFAAYVELGRVAPLMPPTFNLWHDTFAPPVVERVVVAKTDWLCAACLVQAARLALPDAVLTVAQSAAEARRDLEQNIVDLVLSDVVFGDGDVFDLLGAAGAKAKTKFFVVSEELPLGVLERLKAFAVAGVFDTSTENVDAFKAALVTVLSGQYYCSPQLAQRVAAAGVLARFQTALLTPAEQIVLAAIGDGSDDRSAAEQLGLKPSSVKSVRRRLHRKLGFSSTPELMRFAAQYGVVRFTTHGAMRLGFTPLLAAWRKPRADRAERSGH